MSIPALVIWLCALTIAPATIAQDQQPATLEGPMGELDVFLGTWTVSGTWSWGGRLVATATYTPGLNNKYLEVTTSVSDNGAPAYIRYNATLYHDENEGYRLFSKQYDGVAFGASMEKTDNADGTTSWIVRTERDGNAFEEELRIINENAVAWTVKMRQPDGSWMTMLDNAQWLRTPDMTEDTTIDATLIDAHGPDVRRFTKTRTFNAPAQDVYDAWATSRGTLRAMGREDGQMTANIEQKIGGSYEWLWDGKTGSNGCQTLCYIPGRMIAFTWNAPPSLPTRDRRTWVVVQVTPVDDTTSELILTHSGFGEGDDWDRTYDYFNEAWDFVLNTFEENLTD